LLELTPELNPRALLNPQDTDVNPKMAYHKMTYMMPRLTIALQEMDTHMIKYHLKEPNGAICQGYLQSCIEWAAARKNIPLLQLLFTMLQSDPEPLVALQTWPQESFQELMNFIDKNQHLLQYTSGYVTTLNEYMSRYYVDYENLRIFFSSKFGKQFLHKMPMPIEEKNKIFLAGMDAMCIRLALLARAAAAEAAANASTNAEDDPSSEDEQQDAAHPEEDEQEETCYDRAVATGHTCINPYCSECK
jgi:ribosomal protein L12E/L44/L45/RPP1/RPP2